jgi:transposase
VQKTPGLAAQALTWIANLYAIEASIKHLDPLRKHPARQQHSVPLLADLRRWLEAHFPQLLRGMRRLADMQIGFNLASERYG